MDRNLRISFAVTSIIIILSILILFGFAYSKAQSAEDKVVILQNNISNMSNKIDSLVDYFKVTPKQQIINTIKINLEKRPKPIAIMNEPISKVTSKTNQLIKNIHMDETKQVVESVVIPTPEIVAEPVIVAEAPTDKQLDNLSQGEIDRLESLRRNNKSPIAFE